MSGANLFAGTKAGVFLSTNSGASWTAVSAGLTNTNVKCFAVSPDGAGGTNLFAGTYGGGVFLSINNGTSWTVINTGMPVTIIQALAVSGTKIFAATGDKSVFLSTNNGALWFSAGLMSTFLHSLAVSGTNLFAGTNAGVFLSTNNGTSWTEADTCLKNNVVWSLTVSGTNLFAGTNDGGVFCSTNNGTSWTTVNAGLPKASIYGLAVCGTNLFAGTLDNGVWRRPLLEMITSVERLSSVFPTRFRLDQNFPNPFNPSTTIQFALPRATHVSIKVYDVLGLEVVTLVDKHLPPGEYRTTWNAAEVASGVYLFRLQAGDFVATRKALMLK